MLLIYSTLQTYYRFVIENLHRSIIRIDFTVFTITRTSISAVFFPFFRFDQTVIPRVLKPGSR